MGTTIDECFEIVPAAGGGWGHVTVALTRLLERVPRDPRQVVVVGGAGGPAEQYYVQFMTRSDGALYGEAVSNDFVASSDGRLTSEQDDALVDLGWRPPDDPGHPAGSRPSNYWHDWEAPAPLHEAATLAVLSLSAVYALPATQPLMVRVFPGRRKRSRTLRRVRR